MVRSNYSHDCEKRSSPNDDFLSKLLWNLSVLKGLDINHGTRDLDRHYYPTPFHRLLFALFLACLVTAAVNAPVVSVTDAGLSDRTHLGRYDEMLASSVTRMGFPWAFYRSHVSSGVTTPDFSITALVGDVIFACLGTALIVAWLVFRHGNLGATAPAGAAVNRHLVQSARWTAQRFSGGAISALVLATIIAVSLASVAWRYRGERVAINTVAADVHAARTVIMPGFLSQRLPKQWKWSWATVQTLELRDFNSADLKSLSTLSNASALTLNGGRLDEASADAIARLPSLRMLVLNQVKLSAVSANAVAQWSSLTSLRVNGCELDEPLVAAVVSLPNLHELEIVDAAPIITRASQRLTGTSLETVNLVVRTSRAYELSKRGDVESLPVAVSGAVSLKKFSIYAPRAFHVDLALSNLPKFTSLGLSQANVVTLNGRDLPRWHGVDIVGMDHASEDEYDRPVSPLFDRITLANCPSLTSLRLHSRYAQSVELSGVPNLSTLSIDRWITDSNVRPGFGRRPYSDETRFSHLVRQISSIDSLRELQVLHLSLAGVDLSPLASLDRLTTLDLTGCTIDADQVLGLQQLERLDSLTLVHTGIKQEIVDALLCGSNRWKKLQINASTYNDLRLIDQWQLTDFFSQNYFQANNVAIINTPRLEGELRLTRDIETLRIENAPKLRTISVTSDLPARTKISGVRNLKVFEAGGLGMDDEVLLSVCQCDDLRKLILRSGNISRESLSAISVLNGLDSLHLPGMPVDDDLLRECHAMVYLRDIVLDRTQIGAESIAWIATLSNLQRLSINGTNLTPEDLRPLASVAALMHLDVAGVGILPETLADVADSGFLYQLDLSDVTVDQELLDVLKSYQLRKLSILKLKNSGLSDTQLSQLASANPTLVFDGPRSEFGRSLYESLSNEERILVGRSFNDRLARSGAAAEALIESPYGHTTFESVRMTREAERRLDRSPQFNP